MPKIVPAGNRVTRADVQSLARAISVTGYVPNPYQQITPTLLAEDIACWGMKQIVRRNSKLSVLLAKLRDEGVYKTL